jgi:hypothetical protein
MKPYFIHRVRIKLLSSEVTVNTEKPRMWGRHTWRSGEKESMKSLGAKYVDTTSKCGSCDLFSCRQHVWIMCSYDTEDHSFQWWSVHVNCVKLPNTLKSKIESVTFVIQCYSIYWLENQSDNASFATSSQPVTANTVRLTLVVCEDRHT